MVNPEEIGRKIAEYIEKINTEPEHYQQHFESLHSYLEGLSDLAPSNLDKNFLSLIQLILMLVKGLLGFRRAVDDYAKDNETKFNNILERITNIENEFKIMKKGK